MFQSTILRALGLVAGLSVLASLPLMADSRTVGADIDMVQVTSSYPSGYHGKIMATTDAGGTGVVSFHFSDSHGTSLDFTSDQLRKGVVLVHELGKDILKIAAPKFTNDGGGQMILTFLRGFFGSDKRELRFDYIRTGSITDWALLTDDSEGRESFDTVAVTISKSLGLPSGVSGITLQTANHMVRKYDPATLPAGTLRLRGVRRHPSS